MLSNLGLRVAPHGSILGHTPVGRAVHVCYKFFCEHRYLVNDGLPLFNIDIHYKPALPLERQQILEAFLMCIAIMHKLTRKSATVVILLSSSVAPIAY